MFYQNFEYLREYFGGSLISTCSVTHSCLILCNPSDYSPPGFSVHWIILIQIVEWVAIYPSKGSSQPRTELTSPAALALAGDSVSLSHWEAPPLTVPVLLPCCIFSNPHPATILYCGAAKLFDVL